MATETELVNEATEHQGCYGNSTCQIYWNTEDTPVHMAGQRNSIKATTIYSNTCPRRQHRMLRKTSLDHTPVKSLRAHKEGAMAQENGCVKCLGIGVGGILERINPADFNHALSPQTTHIGLPQAIVLSGRMINRFGGLFEPLHHCQ